MPARCSGSPSLFHFVINSFFSILCMQLPMKQWRTKLSQAYVCPEKKIILSFILVLILGFTNSTLHDNCSGLCVTLPTPPYFIKLYILRQTLTINFNQENMRYLT
jgi:hypothetical protein